MLLPLYIARLIFFPPDYFVARTRIYVKSKKERNVAYGIYTFTVLYGTPSAAQNHDMSGFENPAERWSLRGGRQG